MLIKDIIFCKNAENIEQMISKIIDVIHVNGAVQTEDMEKLAYIKLFFPEIFTQYENKLLYVLGLFYKTREPKSFFELCYQAYSIAINETTGRNFTPVQADVLKHIKNNKYFSFSAPTSIGKSYVFRHLIENATKDIVIVVPSRALIAEYLTQVKALVDRNTLVLQFIDNVNIANVNRRIFVVTPERLRELFRWKDDFNVEMFLFDEAQISEEGMRGMIFDAMVRRADIEFPDAKKIFAHPFIKNPEAQFQKHAFVNNMSANVYPQQTVGKIFISHKDEELSFFSPFEESNKTKIENDIIYERLKQKHSTMLVYTSKASIYKYTDMGYLKRYIDLCAPITDPDGLKIIQELSEYLGVSRYRRSDMIENMKRGIVIHHGSIPLHCRILIERFIKLGCAKICFATSTLTQGINMPFDIVWIDAFRFEGDEEQKKLSFKNLIGRAGRTSQEHEFDYGIVVVSDLNRIRVKRMMKADIFLSSESRLNEDIEEVPEDAKDLVGSILDNSFDDMYLMPKVQVERIKHSNINDCIAFVLENIMREKRPIKASEYKELSVATKNNIKLAFERIYLSHMRRNVLNAGEKAVLSTSISILLWLLQGKTFSSILAHRYAYITQKDKQRAVHKKYRDGYISTKQRKQEICAIDLRFSQVANNLPDSTLIFPRSLFPKGSKLEDFKYDMLIFDTYDYLDKVIYLSLSVPLAGAFQQYYETTNDPRAAAMCNFLKYGTNDDVEIWLLRYGFSFEDIEWLKQYIEHIDENKIIFNEHVQEMDDDKKNLVSQYLE